LNISIGHRGLPVIKGGPSNDNKKLEKRDLKGLERGQKASLNQTDSENFRLQSVQKLI
jgi:hypothetical protein